MADRNISIYEAMNIIKRPDTKKDAERQKAFPRADEALIVARNEEQRKRATRMETKKEYRSYAEAVQISDSSEEEQRSREERRIKERKNIEDKKKERRQEKEYNRQRRWYREHDSREMEIQRKDYGLATRDVRRNLSDREEVMTSPLQTNLTSLTTTTRYMTEEVRNLCMIMERRLNIAEEMFMRFEDRQKRQEELFYKLSKGKNRRDRSREEKERKEEIRHRNGD